MVDLRSAISLYELDNDEPPQELEDLVRPPERSTRYWRKYLESGRFDDAWGRRFIYRVPGTGLHDYDLVSLGQDGRPGGEGEDADLANHQ